MGRAGDALAVKVDVVSAVALLLDNLPERRLERHRQRLFEGVEHALVKSDQITFQFQYLCLQGIHLGRGHILGGAGILCRLW